MTVISEQLRPVGKRANCRWCGDPIVWVETEQGKTMPVDPVPVEGGNVVMIRRSGERAPVAKVLANHTVLDEPTFTAHFASCPQAAQRARRHPSPRRGADRAPARPRRCRVGACRWMTLAETEAERDAEWLEHHRVAHPDPDVFSTRCTTPPYCGWTASSSDLDELRRLKREHEATEHALPITCPHGCGWSCGDPSEAARDTAWMKHYRTEHVPASSKETTR